MVAPRRFRRRARARRGAALLLAVVTVVVLSIALQMVYAELSGQLLSLRRERTALTLRALTDAAVASSLAGLDADPLFTGVPDRILGGGRIQSRIVVEGDGTRSLYALGTLDDGERSGLHLRVALTDRGPSVRSVEAWRPKAELAPLPRAPRHALSVPTDPS